MKVVKFSVSLLFTIALIFLLDNSQQIGNTRIPPLAKFLDPFHGFWQNIESKDFQLSNNFKIDGLTDEVTVYYDSLMIPHIFATNDEDMYLAQGYVTAMHRLWQMEFQTHAAAGRISELIGEAALDFDRDQRRIGLTFGAKNMLDAVNKDPNSKGMLDQYSKGVNEFIKSLNYDNLPFEYKLLDYTPEEWTSLKSTLLLKSMAQTLNIGEKDFQMTNMLMLYGIQTLDKLFPDWEKVGDPVADGSGTWNFSPLKITNETPFALPDTLLHDANLSKEHRHIGSNNWAVSGSKTKSGAPILCSDPHLDLGMPSLWFVAHLNSPSQNVMGSSLPGLPGFIIGFNDSVAWGLTNAERDLQDWFKITFKDNKRDQYLLDDKWVSTEKVIEQIRVRGSKLFYDTVVYTHWGPVSYDYNFRGESQRVSHSFRWLSHDPSNEVLTLHKLNRAKNLPDAFEALKHFELPAHNVAIASVAGDIAIKVQGKFPVRRKNEGKFVLDGSKSKSGWSAFIPEEHNIVQVNPLRGFVSSANQYPADSTYPYYIQAVSYEAYRNRRINRKLAVMNTITPSDMMELQTDNYSIQAEEALPLLLANLDATTLTNEQQAIRKMLSTWDFRYDANSVATTYYEEWWRETDRMIWDEMRTAKQSLWYPSDFITIKLIREEPGYEFFDNKETTEIENANMIIRQSFVKAFDKIKDWQNENKKQPTWGLYKNTTIQHLARLQPLSAKVTNGGSGDAINATTKDTGPSWRQIVSLEKAGVQAWGIYPGGQSGNPGSKYYDNFVNTWAQGEYFKLLFSVNQDEIRKKSISTTTLNPFSK